MRRKQGRQPHLSGRRGCPSVRLGCARGWLRCVSDRAHGGGVLGRHVAGSNGVDIDMLCFAHSLARARVMPATPLLAAVYDGTMIPPWNESIEAMLMILPPPCGTMTCAAACDRKKAAFRLIARTSSQSVSLNSIAGARRMMPALLTRMSRRPISATIPVTILVSSVHSGGTQIADHLLVTSPQGTHSRCRFVHLVPGPVRPHPLRLRPGRVPSPDPIPALRR